MTDLPPARILDVSPSEYHKLPGFSASLAKIAHRDSIAHAKDAYDAKMERLAEDDESDAEEEISDDKRKRRDLGTIQHALQLGKGGERIKIIPTSALGKNGAYNTADSKKLRDEARAAGNVPVKEHEVEAHERRAGSIRAQILAAGHRLEGVSELAIEWYEPTTHGPVHCRCMMDHVIAWAFHGDDPPRVVGILDPAARAAAIYDLKIGVANPRRIERSADDQGHAIQAAAYPRALAAVAPHLAGRTEFRFLFCEPVRPFAVWDPTLAATFREIGERRWLRAVRAWGHGLAEGHWPAYRTPENVELRASMWTLKQEGYQPEDY